VANETQLDAALTSRTIRTAQAINTPLNLVDAAASRDAFAKALYSGLFDWIVFEVNKAMVPAKKGGKEMTLGVLDIYGFEIFDDNSLEQFFINWCNEKLQQYFIELTLRSEQEEYAREGIAWTPVEYFDNRIICELIEKKPGGILAILDEDCLLANATDVSFLEKLTKNMGVNKHFKTQQSEQKAGVKGAAKLQRDQFIIGHYAGDVAYKVPGFLNKNRDILFNDQVVLINGSQDSLVAVVFKNVASDTMKRPDTAGTKFKSSLAALIDTLGKCKPSYVRCIKPNETKSALAVEEDRFRHQLRYLGLLENVRVRRAGFCFRQTYERFLGRFKMTCPSTWIQWRGPARAGAEEILKFHKMPKEEFRLGKTKVFIKNPQQLFVLEEAREAKLPSVAIIIQKNWRKAIARIHYRRLKAAVRIQRAFKSYKSRKWLISVVKVESFSLSFFPCCLHAAK
jgi:myosin-1